MLAHVMVAAFGMVLLGLGAAARAGEGEDSAAETAKLKADRHAAEMKKGKSHEDANAAADGK